MKRKVREVMRSREIAGLPDTGTVREAARLMKARHCGSVLVMREKALVGIFTERDAVDRVLAEGRDPGTTPLKEVMTPNPAQIEARALAITALQMMEDGGFRHLPVVDRGEIVGVISRRDFFGEEKAELDSERHIWERIG